MPTWLFKFLLISAYLSSTTQLLIFNSQVSVVPCWVKSLRFVASLCRHWSCCIVKICFFTCSTTSNWLFNPMPDLLGVFFTLDRQKTAESIQHIQISFHVDGRWNVFKNLKQVLDDWEPSQPGTLICVNHNFPVILLNHSWEWFVISCSSGQAVSQNLWSTPYGFQFHPAGAVIKINDMIFVVLAEWQQLCPGWLTLSAVSHSWRSPIPISQIALIPCSLVSVSHPPARLLWSKVVASTEPAAPFSSPRGENVQSSEQMCWENSSHSPARSWWPGSVLGSWERGKRSQGNRLPTQQLTPPLISISSYSHKP